MLFQRQHFAGSTSPAQSTGQDSQSAAQQPSSSADDLHDVSLIDDLAQAYAADPYFADGERTAG